MKHSIFVTWIMLWPIITIGQQIQQRDSICFQQEIIDYSLDTSGNIFLSFKGGSITKYSSELDSLFTYSPLKVADTKLLEAGTGLVIFAFYDFFQEYLITNRFLTGATRSTFPSYTIGYVNLATQSLDNNIWLVENSNYRLIKYNVQLGRIETQSILNTIIESVDNNFTFIKEYQNQVFLVDVNSGIYVFDNIGNFSKFIPAATNKCGFEKENIYYLEDSLLTTANIYSGEKVTEKVETGVWGLMKFNSNTYLVKRNVLTRIRH